jgi:hypothetical protein
MNVVVTRGAREMFAPRELTAAYKDGTKREHYYLNAETGFKAIAYRFDERVLLVYEEAETAVVVLIHRSAWKRNSAKFTCRILHSRGPIGPSEPL